MKTIKTLLLTITALLCSLTATAHDFWVGGIYYTITDATNQTVEVTDRDGNYSDVYTGSVVIPESVTYNDTTYSVTSIGDWTFGNCRGLTSITIPNSVTSIGERAFYNCTGLTSVVIGKNVISIGSSAFGLCTGLTTITIPNSVTSIGNSAFSLCTGLTTITIPNSVTSIGSSAFNNCTGLTSITISNRVTSIGYGAFDSCTRLTSITIPNSVTSIEDYAFRGCTGLTSVVIPNSVTSIGDDSFNGCTGLTSVIIPNSVTSIGLNAFRNCTGLTSIEIHNSVTSIGNYAFHGCTRLKTIINFSNLTFSKGSSSNGYVAYYADKVYNACNGSMEGDFIFGKPNGVNTLVCYLGNATILTLPADYKGDNYVIGADAFKGNKTITSITIHNSVKCIDEYAFSDCTSLKDVKIGDRAVSVERYAFSGCSSLENLRIGDGMKSIEEYAFYNCANLKEIVLGKRINYIGNNAFASSDKIESIYALPTRAINCENATTAFHQNACKYATLYVKESSIDSYETTEPWSKFYIEPIGDFTLTYMVDGEVYKKEKYEYDSEITPLALPEKEGHTFSGWSEIPETMPAEDITVTGSFSVNSYDVTFVVDGEVYQTVRMNYGETITLPEEPTKEGHTFSGWSEIPETMPAEDVVIEGSFAVNSYNLIYIVDDEEYKRESVAYGTAITLSEEPTKEGHTFSGWSEVPATMPAQDITVVGSFSVNSYDVTFVVDGEVYKTVPVNYGEAITLPEEPSKEGHTFGGWSEIPETMPAEDVVIEGSFAVNSYNLIYIVDDEEYKRESVAYGTAITLSEEPTKEGHTFSGWSEVPATMPAKDISVVGSFSVNSYNATFVIDGEVYKTIPIKYGESIPLPEEPVKDGCTFSGWSEIPAIMPAEDITIIGSFYANYYTVTYVVDGEMYATVTVGYNSVFPEMEEPVKEGHTFNGWENVPDIMPAKDITITGSFTVNSYKAIFLVDNALYAILAVNYGEAIELPEPPQKEGFVFDGWDGLPESMPAEDIVLIAIFTDITGIDDVKSEIGKVKTVYDLNGRVVENPKNGIYIINGKKVFVK